MAKGVKIQIIIHKISGSNLKISPHIFSRFNSIQLKEYFHQFDKYSIKEHFTHNNNSSQSIFKSSINTLLNNCSKRLLLNSAVVAPRSSTCVTSINVCGVSWKFCDCFVNKLVKMPLTSDPDGCWLDGRFTRPREMLTGCVVASYGGESTACCSNLPAKFCTRQCNEDMTQIIGKTRFLYPFVM